MAATKPLTSLKIYAVLRKAGIEKATRHASRMIRGWGSWTSGPLVVTKHISGVGTSLVVIWQSDSYSTKSNAEAYHLGKYTAALEASGLTVVPGEGGLIVTQDAV